MCTFEAEGGRGGTKVRSILASSIFSVFLISRTIICGVMMIAMGIKWIYELVLKSSVFESQLPE